MYLEILIALTLLRAVTAVLSFRLALSMSVTETSLQN